MNPSGIQSFFNSSGVVLATALALFAFFAYVTSAIEKYLNLRESRRNRRHTRNLSIIPEPEETAKYSVKVFQNTRNEDLLDKAEDQRKADFYLRRWLDYRLGISIRAQARIATTAILFAIRFMALFMRFLFFAVSPS